MIEINLLPGVQRTTKRRGFDFSPMAAFSGVGARFKDRYLILGSAGLIVGLVAIAGMYLLQAKEQRTLDERESVAATDSARFSAVLKARSRAEVTRDSVFKQLAIIKSIDDTRYTWPHLLEEINLAVPQYTWLTSVVQTSPLTTTAAPDTTANAAHTNAKPDTTKKGPKGAAAVAAAQRARSDSLYNGAANTITFRIVGQTVDVQALTQFMKNLEASPFIRNVQLTRSDLVAVGGQEVTEFQLEAQSEIPPATLLQTVPLTIAVH
jgi:Tfp pilus assembly protein PilN